jgi:CRISPR-associated protein Csa2
VTRYVPVVSGESLAHGYQAILTEIARNMGLSVGKLAARGEFIKYADKGYVEDDGIKPPKSPEDARRFEADVLLHDVIADIGGFLYADKPPVKRTSRIQFGYMLPALDSIQSAALEAQFHARHVPSKTEDTKSGQMPYNVEVGSAVYTTTINLDIDSVSELSTRYGKESKNSEDKLADEKDARKKAALSALMQLLSEIGFGAKKSRFFPNVEFVSAILAVSKPYTFVVSSGASKDYINSTKARADQFKSFIMNTRSAKEMKIDLFAFDKEGKIPDGVESASSIEELMNKVLIRVK